MHDDTDRIIAAHRDEAHKTRVLLAWIFIGIPLIGAVIWLLILILAANRSSRSDGTYNDFAPAYASSVDTSTPELPDSQAIETTKPAVSLSDMQSYVGKPWSDIPQYVQDQTIQVDPWGNIITGLTADKQVKWTVSSVNNEINLTFVMKPIGDPVADGDAHVHDVVYSVSSSGSRASITYSTSGHDQTTVDDNVRVPWTKQMTVASDSVSVDAISDGSGNVTCSLSVDGKLVATDTSSDATSGVASCDYTGPTS